MDRYLEILTRYWGYTSFRPLQEEIIHSVSEGKDTLGLMPTGGGKSLTFQVPAMLMPGLCLVVTPLISLMKDQVDHLKSLGIRAATVYSGMSHEEIQRQLDNCIYGDYRFLYISPERLSSPLFKVKLRSMDISILVVDESHCISQWGYDFRPSYLQIATVRKQFPEVPVLALTATATPEVVEDIQEKLLFREKRVFRQSFVRPNLAYIVRRCEDKEQMLRDILEKVPGSSIIYVRNRQKSQDLAQTLRQAGFSADFFHAGLRREEKEQRQDRWKKGQSRVIVATNAFGMGIDKPDVRTVIHMDIPSSLEEYFQEAGRAGRDGARAYAVALCSSSERVKLNRRLADEYPEKKFVVRVYEALGHYFQVAVGSGTFRTFNFSLKEFCSSYKFSIYRAYHALRIIELAGYIEYVEEPHSASRIMFLVTREDLYHLLHHEPEMDELIRVILRSYTGVFADNISIDEALIASRANLSLQAVCERLVRLAKYHIIRYIPRKNVPQITFLMEREESRYVVIPRFAFEDRRLRDEYRVGKVIEYIEEQQVCRSRMLVHYFGEKKSVDCKVCDVCQTKTTEGLKQWEFNLVCERLVELLTNDRCDVQRLAKELPLEKEKNLTVLRFLLEHDERFRLEEDAVVMVSSGLSEEKDHS